MVFRVMVHFLSVGVNFYKILIPVYDVLITSVLIRTFFIIAQLLTCKTMKNVVLCYNFSCVNIRELRFCHLFDLFIRYTMYHLLY